MARHRSPDNDRTADALPRQADGFPQTPRRLSSGFQSLVVSFASFLIWFALLRHYLASRLGVLSFLTPLLAVALGAWLLAEPIEPGFITGAALALSGIVLVSGYGWLASIMRR